MWGLVKKDLLMIKSNIKLIIVIFFVFTIMALQGSGGLAFIPALISMMLFMSTFSYDEYNKWDSYAITLPNGRKNIVKSKYIATLILIIASLFITFLLYIAVGYMRKDLNIENILMSMLGCGFSVLILQSVMYPLIFKFGIEKARIGLFAGIFAISLIVGVLMTTIKIPMNSTIILFLEQYAIYFAIVIMACIFLASYHISKKIYLKKEF